MDHIENAAENHGIAVGVPVILPSSFSGSPRNMRETCRDEISIFTRFGEHDLFIKTTANPNWQEIKENLRYRESVSDRPDLVAHVFKIKLESILDDITK